jgi:hypothetical protein
MPASWIEQVWDEAINSNNSNRDNANRELARDLDASNEQDTDIPSESSEVSSSIPRHSPESMPDLDATGADELPDGEGALDPNSTEAAQTGTESDEDGLSVFDADSEIDLRSIDSDSQSEMGPGSGEDGSPEENDSELGHTISDAGSAANQDEGLADESDSEDSGASQSSSDSESSDSEDEDDSEDESDYDLNSTTEAEAAADRRYGWEPLRRVLEHAKTARHVGLPNFNWQLIMVMTRACSRTSGAYKLELGLKTSERWRLGPTKLAWSDMISRIHYEFYSAFKKLARIHGATQWSAHVGNKKAEGLFSYSRVMQTALDGLAMYRAEMEAMQKFKHARYLGKVAEQLEQARDALVAAADEINRIPRTTRFFYDRTVISDSPNFCTLCKSRGQALSPIPGTWAAVHQVQDLVVAVYDLCRPLANDQTPEKQFLPWAFEVARDITNANALFEACHPFVFQIESRLWHCRRPYFRELGAFRLHQLRALAMEIWAESINRQLKAGGLIKSGTGEKARVGRLSENVYNGWELGAGLLASDLRKRKNRKLRIDLDELYRAIWFDPNELTLSDIAKIKASSSQS